MPVIFPDAELVLVQHLNTALLAQGTPLASNVRVATKVAPPDVTRPAKQVVINVGYSEETNYVLKRATATVDVYATTYQTASDLARLVDALIRDATGEEIKQVTVRLGPVRTTEETDYERRSLDVELVVKATDL